MHRCFRSVFAPFVLFACLTAAAVQGQEQPPRLEFTRMVAHWAEYGDEGYLPFIEAAEPEVAQIGFYGAHFSSLAHTPLYQTYPDTIPQ